MGFRSAIRTRHLKISLLFVREFHGRRRLDSARCRLVKKASRLDGTVCWQMPFWDVLVWDVWVKLFRAPPSSPPAIPKCVSVKTFTPATEPPEPGRVSEGFLKGPLRGVSEGFFKGFRRVLEGSWKGLRRGQPRPFETPSTRLQEPFKNFSRCRNRSHESAHDSHESAHRKLSSAHENVHQSGLGQFSHVLFSHVVFLAQV